MIAALFVNSGGIYFDVEGVDPWDEARDARTYAGPCRLSLTHLATDGTNYQRSIIKDGDL